VPIGKKLTGVATLIGERLYAACDDMTVRHGLISTGFLDGEIHIEDLNLQRDQNISVCSYRIHRQFRDDFCK
jgi:hypothetical protein